MRKTSSYKTAGTPRTPVNASSQGCFGGVINCPVGKPSLSRCNICAASKIKSASLPAPISRANHGCKPTHAGKSQPFASYSIDQRIASSKTSMRCSKVALPFFEVYGAGRCKSARPGPISCQEEVYPNPCNAFGGSILVGNSKTLPDASLIKPSLMRPAHGPIAYQPCECGCPRYGTVICKSRQINELMRAPLSKSMLI